MGYEFEHWDNGKVYLHEEKWTAFKENVEKYGYNGIQHDWNNNRIFFRLQDPRDVITAIPCIGDPLLKYKIDDHQTWNVIFNPFPAFTRSEQDPEGWSDSWNCWAESRSKGEEITIFTTVFQTFQNVNIFHNSFSHRNMFARFRGKMWAVYDYKEYGFGTHPPPQPQKPQKLSQTQIFRNIFEE